MSGHASGSQRPERTRPPGPVPSLDRADIVAAAVALADEGGLRAVSMRAVAGRMGTSASGLYRYIKDRSELLALMADRVVAELRPIELAPGNGIDALVKMAHAQRDLYRRHPWLKEMDLRLAGAGPETLRYFDTSLRALEGETGSIHAKFEAIAMVTGIAAMFASAPEPRAARQSDAPSTVDSATYPHLAAAAAAAAAAQPYEAKDARDDLLERVVRGVLRGLLAP